MCASNWLLASIAIQRTININAKSLHPANSRTRFYRRCRRVTWSRVRSFVRYSSTPRAVASSSMSCLGCSSTSRWPSSVVVQMPQQQLCARCQRCWCGCCCCCCVGDVALRCSRLRAFKRLKVKVRLLFFMKLFQTGNIEVVRLAQRMFGFVLPSFVIEKRWNNFYMVKYGYIISHCCQLFNLIVFFSFFHSVVFVICLLYCYQLWWIKMYVCINFHKDIVSIIAISSILSEIT